jgi:DNA uptake protein ComE-like DNA-binding protein
VIDSKFTPDNKHAEVEILWVYNDGGSSSYNGKGVEFFVHKKLPGYPNAKKGVPVPTKVDMKNGTGTAKLIVPLPKGYRGGTPLVLTGAWPSSNHQWGTDPGRQGGKFTLPALAGPLDLNKATVADYTKLPGIGPKLAQRIFDYRATLPGGAFKAVEDLQGVKGLSASKVVDLKTAVCLGNQVPKLPKRQETLVVNINTATQKQLTRLPGISAKEAKAIIARRKELGKKKYTATYQLSGAKGVSEATINQILPYITFTGKSQIPRLRAQQNSLLGGGWRASSFRVPWRASHQRPRWGQRASWRARFAR